METMTAWAIALLGSMLLVAFLWITQWLWRGSLKLIAVIIVIGLLALLGYGLWQNVGQQEVRLIEAKAERAIAEADKMRQETAWLHAQAAKELAKAEGDAIRAPAEAAAFTVRMQALSMSLLTLLAPVVLIVGGLALLLGGIAGGLVLSGANLSILSEYARMLMQERTERRQEKREAKAQELDDLPDASAG